MKILAVDDEILALKSLEFKLRECVPDGEYHSFQSSEQALAYLMEETVDVAFLDIHMGDLDGIELAKRIKEISPQCSIVFVTAYSEYAIEAFALKANGYLLKPIRTEDLQRELAYVQQKSAVAPQEKEGLVVQCFGNFDVFYNGRPLTFRRSKSKELLAYLIDRRGAQVSMAQLASVLWEDGRYDQSRNNQIHTFLTELTRALKSVGCEDLLFKERNAVAIDPAKVRCDYYRFLAGDAEAVNAYTGEYMSQYWWSEFTTGNIERE